MVAMKMFNILRMSWFEYKKIFCKKGIYIYLGVFLILVWPLISKMNEIKNLDGEKLQAMILLPVVYFMFMIFAYAIDILLEEYYNGTATFLFTGKMSRGRILFSKILAINLLGVTLGIINCLFNARFKNAIAIQNQISEGKLIFMYLIFSWFAGNYFLFMSTIFKNRFASFLVGIFFLISISDVSTFLRKLNVTNRLVFELNPFDKFMKLFVDSNVSVYKITSLIFFGTVFLFFAIMIFNKKDLS